MTYRGHLAGGLVLAATAALAAPALGLVETSDWVSLAGVAGTALFFSLFPDLDTSSVPQRWFFRAVFGLLICLAWRGQYQVATLVALVALLPVLDQHRGWTHSWWSPLVMPVLLGGIYELWRWPQQMPGERPAFGAIHLACLGAAMWGWYGHLLLDGKLRIFPRDEA